jgi:hypothetical protein
LERTSLISEQVLLYLVERLKLDKTPAEHHVAMTWMQLLKRVFNNDIETCERCAGQVKIIACIEDPAVIKRIQATRIGIRPGGHDGGRRHFPPEGITPENIF